MAKKTNYSDLINFFYELGSLRHMQRSYVLHMLQPVETIAEHSQRITIIAYLLAKRAGVDASKAMIMAAFHDTPEARTGDANWHQKQYVSHDEDKAWQAQLDLIGEGAEEIAAMIEEYRQRKSLVSQIVKDADNLEYTLSLKELALQGNQEALRRLKLAADGNLFYTDIAKELYKQILSSQPHQWYEKDRQSTHQKYKIKK